MLEKLSSPATEAKVLQPDKPAIETIEFLCAPVQMGRHFDRYHGAHFTLRQHLSRLSRPDLG